MLIVISSLNCLGCGYVCLCEFHSQSANNTTQPRSRIGLGLLYKQELFISGLSLISI